MDFFFLVSFLRRTFSSVRNPPFADLSLSMPCFSSSPILRLLIFFSFSSPVGRKLDTVSRFRGLTTRVVSLAYTRLTARTYSTFNQVPTYTYLHLPYLHSLEEATVDASHRITQRCCTVRYQARELSLATRHWATTAQQPIDRTFWARRSIFSEPQDQDGLPAKTWNRFTIQTVTRNFEPSF